MDKICTSMEQSQKLAEILPLKSADMFYRSNEIDVKLMWEHNAQKVTNPCWSLSALLNALEQVKEINHQKVTILVGRYANRHWYVELLRVQDERSVVLEHSKELVNACYEMVTKLKSMNLL